MRSGHLGLGQWCLPLLLVLAACGSPTEIMLPSTPEPTILSMPRTIEETLLNEIAERICPYPDRADKIDPYERYFTTEDPLYTFTCYPAAGHSITVTIRRFAGPAEAQAEFESAAAPGSVQDVLGFPASDWQEQHPSFPDERYEYRVRLLQAGPWVISVRSFDDTHFLIAPDPHQASIAILQVIQEYGLPAIPPVLNLHQPSNDYGNDASLNPGLSSAIMIADQTLCDEVHPEPQPGRRGGPDR